MRTKDHIHFASITAAVLWLLAAQLDAEPPYGLDVRSPIRPFLNDRLPPDQPEAGQWIVVPAFPNLTFPNPVGLIPVPGSNRLCVHTREGRIYVFENNPDVRETQLFLDITSRTQGWDDCGLLGMDFHPEFGRADSTNRGYVYVWYQYSANPTTGPDRPPPKTAGYNRLSRFTVAPGSQSADPTSELVLIDQYDRSVWHNGGAMFFHPDDGFLYLALGDEGGIGGEFANAQRIDRGLFSGVIRIDVNQDPAKSHPIRRQPFSVTGGASRTAHYFIPNDNPFQDPAGGVLEEFWCLGLRSPHRMSCDPVTKAIWLGDVGQEAREEVNLIVKAGNYQWAYKEGILDGFFGKPAALIGTEVPPIFDYTHSRGQALGDGNNCVIGGYVYRGREHADDLGGQYIFGDNGSGRIWALAQSADGSAAVTQIATMPAGFGYSGLSSFGIDHHHELYLCQMGTTGKINKLARPKPSVSPPQVLSQTGAFADLAALQTVPGLIPFTVNSPLWSDAAIKTRWLGLPTDGAPFGPDERITFAPVGEWSFPPGTVLVKHFDLPIDETDPARTKRLETRFLVRDTKGTVYGITYKWRSDNSDADLLPGSLSENLSITLTNPVTRFTEHQDIGVPEVPGSSVWNPADRSYTIASAGSWIGDRADRFHFAYQPRRGDFDIKTRVESFTSAGTAAMAGIMARETLTPESRHILASAYAINPSSTNRNASYAVFFRDQSGGQTETIIASAPAGAPGDPSVWLRLERTGSKFTAYAGTDGTSWVKLGDRLLALPDNVYVGMAIAARDRDPPAAARFMDFAHNRAQTWYYPSPRDCITCHTPVAGHVLGVKTHQLNGLFAYGATGRTDNQLRVWKHLELFQPAFSDSQLATFSRLVPVSDSNAPLERRVRSYLAANCAQCHRPGGVQANFDARYETPLELQGIINGPLVKPLGIPGARVIAPGDLAQSVLFLRISALGEIQMPPLARNTIDNAAVSAVAAWIASLPRGETRSGLRGEYFDDIDLSNLKVTRNDQTISFNWNLGSPDPAIGPETFSVRWTGEIQAAFSETYTFYTTSDDGIRLWIDGRPVIDNWTDHAPTENTGTLELEAGKHHLRLEYFENGGGAQVRLSWSSPSQPQQIVPASRLSSPIDPFFGLAPPVLRFETLADGQMRLVIDAEAKADYALEATADFQQWTELVRYPGQAGILEFIDRQATNYHRRFYRARGQE